MPKQSHKSVVSALEDVERYFRRQDTLFTWQGQVLSRRNKLFLEDLLVVTAGIWLDVTLDPALVNRRWAEAIASVDIDCVISFFKELDAHLVNEAFDSLTSFKRWRKITFPLMGTIISPLTRNIDLFISEGRGLKDLRTALRFATRANFPDPLGLEEAAFEKWKDCSLSPWEATDVSWEAQILSEWFPRRSSVIKYEDFIPKHGPGATAELGTSSLSQKYKCMREDAALRYFYLRTDFPLGTLPRKDATPLTREAVIHFAPKELDKLRTVSMEPTALMFAQLGGFRYINECIRRSSLHKHICLEKAELNMDLAWLGSITGEFATIDLSQASDNVKLDLVKALFHDTNLREMLLLLRSRYALYGDTRYRVEYYAPMGSGLCFPVECLVFASIVEGVCRRHGCTLPWRVYGDDIIVPTAIAIDVMSRLGELGFTVNKEKSFFNEKPGFRESCGGDYMKGEDVRPIYVSRFWTTLKPSYRSPREIASCIDLANRLHRYRTARARVIKDLLTLDPPPLFTPDGEKGLFSTQPTNFNARRRYNDDLQTYEYRTGLIRPRRHYQSSEDDDIRLFEWLRSNYTSSDVSEGELVISPAPRLAWGTTWSSPAPGWSDKLMSEA